MLKVYNYYVQIYNECCKLNNLGLQENLLYLGVMISDLF